MPSRINLDELAVRAELQRLAVDQGAAHPGELRHDDPNRTGTPSRQIAPPGDDAGLVVAGRDIGSTHRRLDDDAGLGERLLDLRNGAILQPGLNAHPKLAFAICLGSAVEYPSRYAWLFGGCLITVELCSPAVAVGQAPTTGQFPILETGGSRPMRSSWMCVTFGLTPECSAISAMTRSSTRAFSAAPALRANQVRTPSLGMSRWRANSSHSTSCGDR